MKYTTALRRTAGQTKDAGFVIGVRKTFRLSLPEAWELVTSEAGMRLWLGEAGGLKLEVGQTYQTREGVEGVVRVVNPKENLRLTWRPKDWTAPSTIQVRVIPSGRKTVISFHQEHLSGPAQREQMRQRWQQTLEALETLLTKP